jgi:hypothetical protein
VGIGSGLFLKFHVLYQVACPSTSWFIYPMNFFDTSTRRPTPTYVHQLRQQIAAPQLVIGLLTIPYCTPNYILNIPSYLPAINIASIATVDSSRSIGYISGSYYGWLVVWNIFYVSICRIGNSHWLLFFRGLKPPTGWWLYTAYYPLIPTYIPMINGISPVISPDSRTVWVSRWRFETGPFVVCPTTPSPLRPLADHGLRHFLAVGFLIMILPSCYLTVRHGKSPLLIGKSSIIGHVQKPCSITKGY